MGESLFAVFCLSYGFVVIRFSAGLAYLLGDSVACFTLAISSNPCRFLAVCFCSYGFASGGVMR